MSKKQRKEHFENIYKRKSWGVYANTHSGRGSSPEFVRNDILYIKEVIKRYNIRSIVDICGDFRWQFDFLKDYGGSYLGIDISETCLARIDKTLYKENISFRQMDACMDPIPPCDLFIARDVLFHLSASEISLFFENIRKSKIQWLLTTTFLSSGASPAIAHSSKAARLNLQAEPWNIVFEETFIGNPLKSGYEQKSLGLVQVKNI